METNKTSLKKKFDWSKWSFIVGAPFALLALLVGVWLGVDKASFITFFSSKWTWIVTVFAFILGIPVWYIRKLSKSNDELLKSNTGLLNSNKEQEVKLTEILEKISEKRPPFIKRWEYLDGNKLKFGSLKYPPMLDFSSTGEPIGIGIDILSKIFNKKLQRQYKALTWEKLNEALYEQDSDGKFNIDIIATPIFETNDRSKNLSFSLPIFYSEIGLYYNASNANFTGLPTKTFAQAKEFIDMQKDDVLFANCIKGEISHKLLKKHFEKKMSEVKDRQELSIQMLLSTIIETEEKSDIVFAETYQAEQLKKMQIQNGNNDFKNLKNLLKPRQLLYPVVFAMRKEDYVLKNYINLKLIEIDGPGSGIVFLINNSLNITDNNFSNMGENAKAEFISEYFVREYNHLT